MKKIVVIGPESVGKTTLCEILAKNNKADWVPEYAREYVENLGRAYCYSDVEHIAKTQLDQFSLQTKKEFLIFDTDLIVTKVWFEHVFRQAPKWLDEAILQENVDLYLLCKPDLEWVEEPVRENPDLREYLYDWYLQEIKKTLVPFEEIEGKGDVRTISAQKAIDKWLK